MGDGGSAGRRRLLSSKKKISGKGCYLIWEMTFGDKVTSWSLRFDCAGLPSPSAVILSLSDSPSEAIWVRMPRLAWRYSSANGLERLSDTPTAITSISSSSRIRDTIGMCIMLLSSCSTASV